MNLLGDQGWLSVERSGKRHQLALRELLCSDTEYRLALPRDDMELAARQMLISLTQVPFTPPDANAWRARLREPMSEAEYEAGIAPFREWFELDHPTMPFMQTRGVKASDATPIQKLFIGLPDGVSHTFFNPEGEIEAVCGGCAAIALFNQASCCPSFGGGFKGSLRGSAPVTTLVDDANLRRSVWLNVLPESELERLLPERPPPDADRPVWTDPIRAGDTIHAADIGLLRGLFWQPAHVELLPAGGGVCAHCGATVGRRYGGFLKEKFVYTLEGLWPHPHSPRQWKLNKGANEERFLSFTTTAPAWTQLTQYLLAREEKREGHSPAAVVAARRANSFARGAMRLLVGGYRNNQANVIERRHELFSFAPGWEDGEAQIRDLVGRALDVRQALRGSLYWAAKGQKGTFKGLGVAVHEIGEARFLARSGPLLLDCLRELDFQGFAEQFATFGSALAALAEAVGEAVTSPYRHDPELVHAIAAARTKLRKDLAALREKEMTDV